ncbi:MAG: hypothetical protein ISS19_03985 [Bacteroidales bacterium]|nr:hypothetical protein [Bacteroidales bacterium]
MPGSRVSSFSTITFLISILTGYEFPDIFEGTKSRFEFPLYYDLQTEGITIQNSDIIFISCERSTFPPQVYWLDLNKILD